jgi:hypothetical protein
MKKKIYKDVIKNIYLTKVKKYIKILIFDFSKLKNVNIFLQIYPNALRNATQRVLGQWQKNSTNGKALCFSFYWLFTLLLYMGTILRYLFRRLNIILNKIYFSI